MVAQGGSTQSGVHLGGNFFLLARSQLGGRPICSDQLPYSWAQLRQALKRKEGNGTGKKCFNMVESELCNVVPLQLSCWNFGFRVGAGFGLLLLGSTPVVDRTSGGGGSEHFFLLPAWPLWSPLVPFGQNPGGGTSIRAVQPIRTGIFFAARVLTKVRFVAPPGQAALPSDPLDPLGLG